MGLGLVFVMKVQDLSGNHEFLLQLQSGPQQVYQCLPILSTSSTMLNHLATISYSSLSGVFFPRRSFLPSGEANEISLYNSKDIWLCIFKEKSPNALLLQHPEQPVTKLRRP